MTAATRPPASVATVPGRALLNLLPALALQAGRIAPVHEGALPAQAPNVATAAGAGPLLAMVASGTALADAGALQDDFGPSPSNHPRVLRSHGGNAVARALGAAIGTLDGLVQRRVDVAIARLAGRRARDRGFAPGQGVAADPATEETVRALMQKMRDLAQEERFRSGRLR